MKKLLYGISAMLLLFTVSCSVSQDEVEEPTMSNNPASGKLYGNNFTVNAAGGKAQNITANDIEGVYIYLTNNTVGCGETPDGFEWPIWIFTPRAVGTYTFQDHADITFKDPDADSFEGAFNVKVEIISVGETVVGRVVAGYPGDQNYINGKFEVPYCN